MPGFASYDPDPQRAGKPILVSIRELALDDLGALTVFEITAITRTREEDLVNETLTDELHLREVQRGVSEFSHPGN